MPELSLEELRARINNRRLNSQLETIEDLDNLHDALLTTQALLSVAMESNLEYISNQVLHQYLSQLLELNSSVIKAIGL